MPLLQWLGDLYKQEMQTVMAQVRTDVDKTIKGDSIIQFTFILISLFGVVVASMRETEFASNPVLAIARGNTIQLIQVLPYGKMMFSVSHSPSPLLFLS